MLKDSVGSVGLKMESGLLLGAVFGGLWSQVVTSSDSDSVFLEKLLG